MGTTTLSIDAEWQSNELAPLNNQIQSDAVEIYSNALFCGLQSVTGFDNKHEMGYGIHEMEFGQNGKRSKDFRTQ